MRYMFLVKSDNSVPPTPELFEAMGALIERETKSGRLKDTGGLMPPEMGVMMSVSDGKVVMLDGPFTESKEVIGGYAVFELQSRDEAVEAATEFMELHARHMPGWTGLCEVRLIASV